MSDDNYLYQVFSGTEERRFMAESPFCGSVELVETVGKAALLTRTVGIFEEVVWSRVKLDRRLKQA